MAEDNRNPYDMSLWDISDTTVEVPQAREIPIAVNKNDHRRVEKIHRDNLAQIYSNVSGIPKWALPYIMNFSGGTANIIGEGLEFIEGFAENIAGYSREEQIADGKNPLSVFLEEYYDFTNAFDTKYYDDSGKVLDFQELMQKGEWGKAATVASEQAAESAPSIIMSVINPLLGGAVMGISTAGGQYKDDLVNRPDQSLDAVIKNSLWAGGSEMITEIAGGYAFRGINALGAGKTLKVVNDFTSNYVLRLVGRTLGSGVAEASTEAVNSFFQDVGDVTFYDDEVTTKQFVKNIVNSVGPAFILGGLGGGAGSIRPRDNQELYKFVAPRQWKQEYLNIGKNIHEANLDLENAPENKKDVFKQRIKKLVEERTKHENNLFDIFDSLSKTELKRYAQNIDKANQNMDIIGNNKYSKSAQDAARQENLKYIESNLKILGRKYTDADIALEQDLGTILKASEVIEERLKKIKGINRDDLDIKVLTNQQEIDDAVKLAGKGVKNSDGAFIANNNGKATIYINKNVASAAEATNVLGHELLHYMISRKFKTDNKSMQPLVNELKSYLQQNNPEIAARVQERIDEHYTDDNGNIKDGALEEYLNVFSDLMSKQKLNLKDVNSKGVIGEVKDLMSGFGFGEIKLNSAQDVISFLNTYNKNINRKGLLGKVMGTKVLDVDLISDVLVKGQDKKPVKKRSKTTPLEAINKLIPENVKTQEDYYNVLNDPRIAKTAGIERVFDGKNLAPVIEAYIRSRSTSSDMATENIEAVKKRLVNFDPAAKRQDGSTVGSKGFGEFIFANARFGKMVAAKKLATKAAETKRTTKLDDPDVKDIADTPTPTEETQAQDVKLRKLKDFNVNLDDGLADALTVVEVNDILDNFNNGKITFEQAQKQIDKIVLKDIRAGLSKTIPKISKGKPTPEYEAFIRKEYDEIIQSLGIKTIRTSYKKFFTQEKTGVQDYKNIDPVTGKESNYRKSTQINTTNKREFIRYFLEAKGGVLNERRTALIRRIAKRKASLAVDSYIEQNSNNIEAIVKAKIRTLSDTAENATNEQVSFDSVKFSNSFQGNVKRITNSRNSKGLYTAPDGTKVKLIDLGRVFEQAFSETLQEVAKNIKGFVVDSLVSTEAGGVADAIISYLGIKENHEIKKGLTAFMGSTLFNAFDVKSGAFTLANEVHNSIKGLKGFVKKVAKNLDAKTKVINKEIDSYNQKYGYKKGDAEFAEQITGNVVKGKPEFVPAEVLNNLQSKELGVLKAGIEIIQNHYGTKKAGAVKSISLFGFGSFRLDESSIFKGLPMLDVNTEVYASIRTTGSQMRGKQKFRNIKIGLQFRLDGKPKNTPNSGIITEQSILEALGNPPAFSKNVDNTTKLSKSINASRLIKENKGITILDFDDTLATTESLVKYTAPDGTTGALNAEEYARDYQGLLEQGYTFDFSEFNKVVKGKIAPLFQKALKLQKKFGPENMFVLTARPPQAQKAIFDFLKANGLNIPLKNITGLANSTAEAKALWIADKVGEGYNDFYFADDALQNVQAVDNMLEQFDVKRKVQQAKINFSKTMNEQFNDIIEDVTGIESVKRFDFIKARKRGASKGKFRFFVPPSHEDFVGLLYNFMGKGRKGDAHRDFLEQALVRPLNRANREYDTARQSIATDYKNLNKQMPDVKKMFAKKTPDGDFTYQDAIRVYIWDKHGYTIPGLSPVDQKNLVELVKKEPGLQMYGDAINTISRQETYVDPTENWEAGDFRTDLDDATGRVGRAQFFEEFNENADIIFSSENLNKIEAGYGANVKEALQDMLYRIKTGRNRPSGQNAMVNRLMNYLNGSVGSVMFFNMRSALLQQMSLVNYINFADNNIFAAAKAFANQKQYWSDWSFIFNSDMLKQRRGGIQTDVNGAELAAEMRKAKYPHRFLISKLLQLGFLPTQIGDNIAIATGGATYYRNRINTYLKEGLSKKEAEAKAFTDFQDITQSTQQSARPDMVSQQQASVIGKVILNFQNVTSQFNRLGKKAFQDIYNRRITKPNTTQMQSDISNAARITYYFAVQNAIFYTLQTALFAMMFDDDEEDVNNLFLKKKERLINGSIDSVLRGTGITGAVISTLKNVAIAFARQRDVNYNPDESAVVVEALNFSPVVGIKARKIVNAEKTLNYNKKVIKEMDDFDIDNPQWSAVTNYVEGFTNAPLNRLYNKTQNIRQSFNNEHSAWERMLMFLGWSQYNLGLENKEIEEVKRKIKRKKPKSRTKSKKNPNLKVNI